MTAHDKSKWKLVPVEPTEEMLWAWAKGSCLHNLVHLAHGQTASDEVVTQEAKAIYAAMLAAAPEQQPTKP